MELDRIDKLAASVLDGYLVRKDLVRTFSRQFPVPTYVVEFLLGRYCASTDPEEIEEGLAGETDRVLKKRQPENIFYKDSEGNELEVYVEPVMKEPVLYIFGAPVAKDLDGRVLVEILDEEFVKANPMRIIDSYEAPFSRRARQPATPEGSEMEKELKRRLKTLQYLQ